MNKKIVNRKKAAVYDRWLFTLGGGEQVAFAYAISLRDLGFETSLLTHQEVDIKKAQNKMGINLEGIVLMYLPMMSSEQLAEYTEEYDVFVNTSYLDYFPNRSKMGILSIFFPSQIFLTPYEYVKRAIVLPSFSRLFIYPSLFFGFKYDHYMKGRIYKWMTHTSIIAFNQNIGRFSVTFFFQSFGISIIDQMRFFVDDRQIQPISKSIHTRDNLVTFTFHAHHTAHHQFKIVLPDSSLSEHVALVRLTIFDIRFALYNVFKRAFPTWEMRLHGGPGVTKLSDLTSYDKILTISQFSRHWIRKYWGLESEVLYPPVATKNFFSSPHKKNWIIHVGRFFVTGHSKKQLDLVKIFRLLIDEKKITDWELHFVGSVHEGEKHKQYFEQVCYYAKGYPIFFHMDASFQELRECLSKSKIYWHATGLDENEDRSPILFEHFGITTVEAMASGCVPVVIRAGGQKEIVTPDCGVLWRTRKELLDMTYALMQDPMRLKALSSESMKRSVYFDKSQFSHRLKTLLAK